MSYPVCDVCVHGVVVWLRLCLGGKYVLATVMCLVLRMCILTSCSSVLCVLMTLCMFMSVKVMLSLMSVLILLLVCVPCLCVW